MPRLAGESVQRVVARAAAASGADRQTWWSLAGHLTEHLSPSVGRAAAARVLEAAGAAGGVAADAAAGRAVIGDGTSVGSGAANRPPGPGLLRPDVRLHGPTGPCPRGDAPHAGPDGPGAGDVGAGRRPGTELCRRPAHGPAGAAARHPRAARLAARVVTFAEALERHAPDWTPPAVNRPATGQTHCHQHAVLGDAADRRLREAAGLTGELTGGCCGLAGQLRFRGRPLRGLGRLRGGPAAPGGARGTGRGGGPGGRLLVPDAAGAVGRGAGGVIWRRCWRRRWRASDGQVAAVPSPGRSKKARTEPG
ncbi:hypothetical protein LV779_30110 [Streptomyces thinghirensis]|nr:hypothetical protein [Streptomyces thinghirensis]